MTFNRNEFVGAFSLALDFLESSLRSNVTNHGKRVALIALRLGEQLGLSSEDMFDLYAGAMLHDNGMTHAVYDAIDAAKLPDMERDASHCIVGERNLKAFPFLKNREGMILYHHEAYDGSGYFGAFGGSIPLLAHIINLADTTEILYSKGADKQAMMERLALWKGGKFSAELCEAFEAFGGNLGFWLSLDNKFIAQELARRAPKYDMALSLEELLPIAGIFRRLIDAKSPFTGRHSQGITEKSALMADFYGFDAERKAKLMIAADLHDAGKLAVPNAVLDKPGALDAAEIEIVKPHPYYTRKMLENIIGFEDVTEWASNHHEKLDGAGYPYGFTAERLDFESRLMACIDIFQALTEDRPYRKPLDQGTVSRIMFDMASKGGIDRQITADVLAANKENMST
ncbi:MAG: HD domain-containing protein [Treponema sp.]|nr:HD domain-containing protein [Treponema sp.]